MIFSPLQSKVQGGSGTSKEGNCVQSEEPPKPPPPAAPKSSIFSVGMRSIQENDQNLRNLPMKKNMSGEFEKLAISDPVLEQPKPVLQATEVLKTKKISDDPVDIIRYRPINQKRVQQQKQQAKTVSSSSSTAWQKSGESSGDSGISTTIKGFALATPADNKDRVDAPKPQPDAVFATPGFSKAPLVTGSRRMPNPRMPVSSATKNQSAIKEEFQQRKVLFTTPMGGSCKPVASLGNASITFGLDESLQYHNPIKSRLPGVDEVVKEPPVIEDEVDQQQQDKDRRQIRRIKNKDYEIEKKIGHGGSSVVFLCRQLDTDQEMALKVVDLQGDDAIMGGYLKETELLASLQGNPSIITLFD